VEKAKQKIILLAKEEHSHIGFYIGNKKAISSDFKKGVPAIRNFIYNNQRKIEAIYPAPRA